MYDRLIVAFIPPQTEMDYKVLSIWTTKTVEELKETIINMSKFMFLRDNALTEIIAKIEKELRTISRRK